MRYKTELHCHSGIVSACGRISPERIVERYTEAGYSTVVLTEHLSRATFDCANYGGADTWEDKIDFYMNGVNALRAAAAGKLHILLGCEVRLDAHAAADFLIYGLDEAFLRNHRDLLTYHLHSLADYVHKANFLLYQAHPFRNGMIVADPRRLDGVEVFNGNSRQCSRNDVAEYWAKRFRLSQSSGSDLHRDDDAIAGGIETDAPITTNEELMAVLRSGNYTLLRDESIPGQDTFE